MIKKIQGYIAKYGNADTWSLALKFQVLFETLKELVNKGTVHSGAMEHVHTVLWKLSEIPNSGVVEVKSELKDKQFEDTLICEYTCGKYSIRFERDNDYDLRSGITTDCYLSVNKK